MNPTQTVSVALVAFLLGSIPFSWLLARISGGIDIRRVGSGNVGATNVVRAIGFGPGVLALGLDATKGALAVQCARWIGGETAGTPLLALAGLAAVLGHCFTPFLRFRGGKGVATGAGVFGVLAPWGLVCALMVFMGVVALTRIVALGSVAAATALPVATHLVYRDLPTTLVALIVAALVVIFHRGNLNRILRGSEDRLGKKDPGKTTEKVR